MMIRLVTWEELKARLSREEFEQLARARTGESISPRGHEIDEDLLDDELRDKVVNLVLAVGRESYER